MGRKELTQIKGSCHTNGHGILKLLVGTICDSPHNGERVVNQNIHPSVLGNHLFGKGIQYLLAGNISHTRSIEYASRIMEAMVTDNAYKIGGNVINNGLIENLPREACVEVPCLVNKFGIQPTVVGRIPTQCAAMKMTNINVQLLTIEAAVTRKKDAIYQAAMLDPHTSSELSIDDIVKMCDDLIEEHGDWLPKYN